MHLTIQVLRVGLQICVGLLISCTTCRREDIHPGYHYTEAAGDEKRREDHSNTSTNTIAQLHNELMDYGPPHDQTSKHPKSNIQKQMDMCQKTTTRGGCVTAHPCGMLGQAAQLPFPLQNVKQQAIKSRLPGLG